MSESRSTNPWKPWQRLLDPIGPDYRRQLLKARNRATRAIDDLYKDELAWSSAARVCRRAPKEHDFPALAVEHQPPYLQFCLVDVHFAAMRPAESRRRRSARIGAACFADRPRAD